MVVDSGPEESDFISSLNAVNLDLAWSSSRRFLIPVIAYPWYECERMESSYTLTCTIYDHFCLPWVSRKWRGEEWEKREREVGTHPQARTRARMKYVCERELTRAGDRHSDAHSLSPLFLPHESADTHAHAHEHTRTKRDSEKERDIKRVCVCVWGREGVSESEWERSRTGSMIVILNFERQFMSSGEISCPFWSKQVTIMLSDFRSLIIGHTCCV